MSLHKSDGIILRRDRSGESSLLVELFLRGEGKTRLVAKGARKPGAGMSGKLEQFSEVELTYYRKSDDSLGYISDINQVRENSALGGDIRRLSYASTVVEIIENLVYSGAQEARLFDLLRGTFYMMNYCPPGKLEFFLLVFMLKALDIIGLSPQLDVCIKTGKEITGEEVFFSVEEGGIIDKEMTRDEGKYLKLDQGIIKVLKEARKSDIDKMKGLNFSEKQKSVIKDMLFSFMSYHTEGKASFKSLDFLSKIANY